MSWLDEQAGGLQNGQEIMRRIEERGVQDCVRDTARVLQNGQEIMRRIIRSIPGIQTVNAELIDNMRSIYLNSKSALPQPEHIELASLPSRMQNPHEPRMTTPKKAKVWHGLRIQT